MFSITAVESTSTTWKQSAIRYKEGMLILSNGKANAPLKMPLPVHIDVDNIVVIHLVFNNGHSEVYTD